MECDKNLPAVGVGGLQDMRAPAGVGRQGMSLFPEADGGLPRSLYDLIHTGVWLTEDYQFIDRIVVAPIRKKSRGSSGTSYRPPGLATQPLPRMETAALELALMIRTLKAKLVLRRAHQRFLLRRYLPCGEIHRPPLRKRPKAEPYFVN